VKVLLSWLREFCPVEVSAEDLAETLIANGVHVEEVVRPWERLSGVVVARVLEVRDHPNSDKLCVARVTDGRAERQVLAGVRNMQAGDLVPLAAPGATVPALPDPLQPRTLRGEVSDGMLCSPHELALSADHGGILILPSDTPVGADFKELFGLDEVVLDVEIEPNRPDLMSVFGVAREAAAATATPLTPPDTSLAESDEKAADAATVEIRDLDRCPRYLARVIRTVTVGPSPIRVQARLTAAGMRPLSNVVDATNYVLLEMGHPLHPFDLALLEGAGIVVRRAEEGERLTTLDDVERSLTADDLVIADHAKAVAIAGVMGSASAEVSADTRDVLLESAYFERKGILWTARRLGLQTEASLRFERGADPEVVPKAADRAARLIAEWSGGAVLAGSVGSGEAPPRRRLSIRPERASLIIGSGVTAADIREAFGRLRVQATDRPVDDEVGVEVEVEVPSYRVDLDREIDLIEEVARIRGYDRVGSTLPGIRQAGGLQPSYAHRRRVRQAMVRAGLRETISLSFASPADLELMSFAPAAAVRLANPLTADDGFLRASLIPGLLRALARNLARQVRGAALFEVGRTFRLGGDEGRPVGERDSLAFAMTGLLLPGVHGDPRDADFFDAKGALEAVMASLGIGDDWALGEAPGWPFHPARSAVVAVAGAPVGVIGELHPRAARLQDFRSPVAVAELDSGALAEHATDVVAYRDVPRFPPVRRDLSFYVDASVPAGRMREVLLEAAGGLADTAVLFDLFTGPPVPEGKKSLAFSVDFRAPDRTLTDEEVDASVAAIVQRLGAEFGAELRAG
jgi:phenylalanyl-tRNA synthetase beta chain